MINTEYIRRLAVLGWLFSATLVSSAQKHDYNWVMGIHDLPGVTGYNNAILHFTGNGMDVEEVDLHMNFESTVASMSDSSGALIFYTNGCVVSGADGEPLQGGSGLNPGEIHDWVCDQAGYICPRGAMAIPLPGTSGQYILLHMGARYDPAKKLRFGPLYYSVIDMSENGGKGAVTSKNNPLIDGDLEPFCATRHGNGRDWWIVVPEYGTQKYVSFLLTPYGIEGPFVQQIGPFMQCRSIGNSVFSLDGRKYARSHNCRVTTFDFDRCTGLFSNPRLLLLPPYLVGGGGLAFSPDNQRLLFASQLQIFEADLSQSVPELDSAFVWNYQWGVSLQYMQYAPNGQIVVNHMHRTDYLSLIRHPDQSGEDMDFKPKGLTLPVFSVRSLPNYPNYRLYDLPDSPCDSLGINSPTVGVSAPDADAEITLFIHPNPARGNVHFSLPVPEPGHWKLMDITGNMVLQGAWEGSALSLNLDRYNGLFYIQVQLADGKCYVGKVLLL